MLYEYRIMVAESAVPVIDQLLLFCVRVFCPNSLFILLSSSRRVYQKSYCDCVKISAWRYLTYKSNFTVCLNLKKLLFIPLT